MSVKNNNIIVVAAQLLRMRYRYELDSCIDVNSFFKAKFRNDQEETLRICKNLHKKVQY